MAEEKVRIGIVGIGNMGKNHVRHVVDLPNTKLAAVCDRKAERFETAFAPEDPPEAASTDEIDPAEPADPAPIDETDDGEPDYAAIIADTPQFTDYEQMLEEVELDAVIIATPHFDHPDMSLMAFERGIHVLVEKPIAVHVKEAQRLIDGYCAAKEAHPDLVFAAMFMQRTWGHWRVIKSMIDQGASWASSFAAAGSSPIGSARRAIMTAAAGARLGAAKAAAR